MTYKYHSRLKFSNNKNFMVTLFEAIQLSRLEGESYSSLFGGKK